MILHVFEPDKFIPPFVRLVLNAMADPQQHVFFCWGDPSRYGVDAECDALIAPQGGRYARMVGLQRQLYAADKIILHGLFVPEVTRLLALQPWLLPKCHWMIWGGDLYAYKLQSRACRWRLEEFFRRRVIRGVGHLVTYLEGDVAFAREWYGAQGRHHPCLMYPSNVFRDVPLPPRAGSRVRIQIGNSADPSNEHFELLDLLKPHRDADIEIVAPLSYGDREHAARVAARGREYFGPKFLPLLDFIPLAQYLELLAGTDIALFNHRRQQGMGNTINLLGLGKRVYLRSDVTPWKLFQELGVAVFDIAKFELAVLNDALAEHNRGVIRREFSEAVLRGQLETLFQDAPLSHSLAQA